MSKKNAFLTHLALEEERKIIPYKVCQILKGFYTSYQKSVESHHLPTTDHDQIFIKFLDYVKEQIKNPFSFDPYHQKIRKPIDYYQFGVDFMKPLVDLELSSVLGKDNLNRIAAQVANKENVILLANHQTEADPQTISVLLEDLHPEIGEEMIFVAGERVLTDPLAIPFSMGRNLLCIYSKKYIDNPPEQKHAKQLHNQFTMRIMSQLLTEGGKCIYVAPSGGRDRPNEQGVVEVAPFDPQSIEMFYLMAQKSKTPTHFYPLALSTYDLLPPPNTIQTELGETRLTKRGDIHLCFGEEIIMDQIPDLPENKVEKREKRANYIWNIVKNDYARISSL